MWDPEIVWLNAPVFVIAGLVPAIHTRRQGTARPGGSVIMDSRHKAGNDGCVEVGRVRMNP
ncbi:MAG: hypothetical protein C0461_08260 [Brevundimonas sp.]|nr:hypothetical protein [Brevundimonas sp.]